MRIASSKRAMSLIYPGVCGHVVPNTALERSQEMQAENFACVNRELLVN
jgi:hypothetical protein